jgi:hypothetical protein
MKTLLFILLFVLTITKSFAEEKSNHHLKNCTLMPITDNVNGALSFRVYDIIDRELKVSNWCSYRSNSGVLTIFSGYRDKVHEYIDKAEVLKIVSQKLDVGSIIRIALESRVGGVAVRMLVYVNEGEDVAFDEQIFVQEEKIEVVAQQIKTWLIQYAENLPYDGLVSGVLGEQVTVDVARTSGLKVNQDFVVKRFVRVKKHPLLNKIAEWETQNIAKGKIFNVAEGQVVGVLKIFYTDGAVKAGDWVSVQTQQYALDESLTKDDIKKNEFGKLGIAGIMIQTGNSTLTSVHTTNSKFEGLNSGVNFFSDIYITRNYFGRIVLERSFGDLDSASSTTTSDNLNVTSSVFKLLGGYKILPLGFFYGPQIDVYGGYGNYLYDTEYSNADNTGEGSFGGFLFGTKVEMPVTRGIRGFVRVETMFLADFNDSDNVYPNERSTSNIYFNLGANYEWSPIIGIQGEIEVVNNKAKFDHPTDKEVNYQSTNFKLGFTYSF